MKKNINEGFFNKPTENKGHIINNAFNAMKQAFDEYIKDVHGGDDLILTGAIFISDDDAYQDFLNYCNNLAQINSSEFTQDIFEVIRSRWVSSELQLLQKQGKLYDRLLLQYYNTYEDYICKNTWCDYNDKMVVHWEGDNLVITLSQYLTGKKFDFIFDKQQSLELIEGCIRGPMNYEGNINLITATK